MWLLPAWLISNTFWTMSLSMSRLLTMFRNSFVMRRAGFRSREINYERSQNDWQKGKQTGLRNCAQPGNCPVQPAHETWPARTPHFVYQTCAGKLSDRQPDPVRSGFPGKASENRTQEPKLTGARLGKFSLTEIALIGFKFK